ncbi:MAG: hypothetical protein AMK73_03945 [Planctomycetes bacterium SM23_32]|nr:MAG: hypothetical protein AMK73_03945 [Planctomycetes bacterium SM23_32]
MRNVEEYLRPDVIQEVARLDLKARFIVEGFISGLHESPYHGFSSEFSEHRKYTAGDDPKHLDWKVFARTDKFYLKRFEAETNLDCHILLDASESMAYSYGGVITKLEYAIYMAAALGYMMIHQQDNVGLVAFDEEVTNVVPAKSKRSHLVAILGVLAGSLRHRPSRLAACLHRAADLVRSRGVVILFSDLIPAEDEDQEQVMEGLRHIRYRGHDVICFQLLDHAELTFPFEGPTQFVDVESLRALRADPQAVAGVYREELQRFIGRYAEGCRHAEIDFVPVDTADSFDRVLLSFLRRRQTKF